MNSKKQFLKGNLLPLVCIYDFTGRLVTFWLSSLKGEGKLASYPSEQREKWNSTHSTER